MAKMKTFRELLSRLPEDGEVRHAFRNFNFGMSDGGALPSAAGLARLLGFDVVLVPLPANVRGRLVADTFADRGFRIEVNQADDVRTRRWTVLHELMHAFLHFREDPLADPQYRAGGRHFYLADEQEEEREANAFVEALIFGENALVAARTMFGDNEEDLAKKFGVSIPTLRNALRKL